MNAPDTTSAYQFLALDAIVPSNSHIQQLRRARFNPAEMAELVASVTAHGVLQPIVVRGNIAGIESAENAIPWEIVAGERRWIAARAANLPHIPVIARELTDLQVVEIQLVENLQRENLHPLEEAEGFADLMQLKGVSAEEIAETIGRSKSHVHARLKLLDLIPAAREAFNSGTIDLSKAQRIARIPVPKLQAKALKLAATPDYRGDAISFRDFTHGLANNKFVVELKHATFRLNDSNLLPTAGNCIECPKRTGNLGDLFVDVKNPDVCTDPICFDKKTVAHQKWLRATAEQAGRTILSGDAAKAIMGHQDQLRGYIDLDEESDEQFSEPQPPQRVDEVDDLRYERWAERKEAFTPRTYRQILGNLEGVALLDAGKKLREILSIDDARELLKPHGITLPDWLDRKPDPTDPAARKEEEEKQHERQEHEKAFRCALLAQIHAKWKPPLKHEDLVAIAFSALSDAGLGPGLAALYGSEDIDLPKMTDADLMRLLVELTISEQVDYVHHNPAPLLALAKRCKIDPAKVKKDLAAAARGKADPAPAGKALATKKAPASKKTTKKSHK